MFSIKKLFVKEKVDEKVEVKSKKIDKKKKKKEVEEPKLSPLENLLTKQIELLDAQDEILNRKLDVINEKLAFIVAAIEKKSNKTKVEQKVEEKTVKTENTGELIPGTDERLPF